VVTFGVLFQLPVLCVLQRAAAKTTQYYDKRSDVLTVVLLTTLAAEVQQSLQRLQMTTRSPAVARIADRTGCQ